MNDAEIYEYLKEKITILEKEMLKNTMHLQMYRKVIGSASSPSVIASLNNPNLCEWFKKMYETRTNEKYKDQKIYLFPSNNAVFKKILNSGISELIKRKMIPKFYKSNLKNDLIDNINMISMQFTSAYKEGKTEIYIVVLEGK